MGSAGVSFRWESACTPRGCAASPPAWRTARATPPAALLGTSAPALTPHMAPKMETGWRPRQVVGKTGFEPVDEGALNLRRHTPFAES